MKKIFKKIIPIITLGLLTTVPVLSAVSCSSSTTEQTSDQKIYKEIEFFDLDNFYETYLKGQNARCQKAIDLGYIRNYPIYMIPIGLGSYIPDMKSNSNDGLLKSMPLDVGAITTPQDAAWFFIDMFAPQMRWHSDVPFNFQWYKDFINLIKTKPDLKIHTWILPSDDYWYDNAKKYNWDTLTSQWTSETKMDWIDLTNKNYGFPTAADLPCNYKLCKYEISYTEKEIENTPGNHDLQFERKIN